MSNLDISISNEVGSQFVQTLSIEKKISPLKIQIFGAYHIILRDLANDSAAQMICLNKIVDFIEGHYVMNCEFNEAMDQVRDLEKEAEIRIKTFQGQVKLNEQLDAKNKVLLDCLTGMLKTWNPIMSEYKHMDKWSEEIMRVKKVVENNQ